MKTLKQMCAVVLVMCFGAVAVAQEEARTVWGPNQLADRFERLARMSLSYQGQPHPAQVRRAKALIDRANALDDGSAERWWLAFEMNTLMGDSDGALGAIQQYVRLMPEDDVAQTQLIRALADRQQTVDARLKFYLKIADGPASRRFSRPLRAYVSMWAAQLYRELGQIDQYKRMVALALQLDPTNKSAAAESFQIVASDAESTLSDKAAALYVSYNADPTDPFAYIGVGNTLLAFGAYDEAFIWLSKGAELTSKQGGTPGVDLLQATILAAWGEGDFEIANTILNILDPEPQEGQELPADWPPVDVLLLKAVVTATAGNAEGVREIHGRIERRLAPRVASGSDSVAMINLVWAHLLLNQGLDAAEKLIGELEGLEGEQPMLRGWLAMRRGDREAAEGYLEPLADQDHRAALGLALPRSPDAADGELIGLLHRVVRHSPDDLFGLTAASMLKRLDAPMPANEDRVYLQKTFATIPQPILQMEANPMRYIQLKVEPVESRLKLGEPFEVVVQIRNMSKVPLSLGSDGTVPTNVMLLPKLTMPGEAAVPLAPIEVDLHRRLRLDIGRTLAVTVPLQTHHMVGAALDGSPSSRVQIDMVCVLNPYVTKIGGVRSGLMGGTAQFYNMSRGATPLSDGEIERLIQQIGSAHQEEMMRAMYLLGPWCGRGEEDATLEPRVADIAKAMTDRFDSLTPTLQAFAVLCIPRGEYGDAKFAALIDKAGTSDRVDVQLALLSTRCKRSDHPLLTAAMRDGDAVISDFAEASIELLEIAEEQLAEGAEMDPVESQEEDLGATEATEPATQPADTGSPMDIFK